MAIDYYGRLPALGEPQGELFVEAVETADVREDDDSDAARLIGKRGECGELVPVGGLEHEVLVRDGGSRDGRDRRQRVELEAHGGSRIVAV